MAGLPAIGEAVHAETSRGPIAGICDKRFRAVFEAFRENFEQRGELGASCAVTVDGKLVVDLWGGTARQPYGDAPSEPWTRDTVAVVFSATKGATAFAAHWLADRGTLDLDALVTEYWPAYGVNGKESTRVSMFLDHTAGIPVLRGSIPAADTLDFDAMAARVAAETPFFEPGAVLSYHGMTFAWTVGSVIRKSGGRPLGSLFSVEIAGPLGLDFWIGTPADILPRLAMLRPSRATPNGPISLHARRVKSSPGSVPHLFLSNLAGVSYNRPETLAAEIGSANGVTNARGLAGLYAPLANGGQLNGVRFVGPDTLARMKRVSAASSLDQTLLLPMRFGLGFMRASGSERLPEPENRELIPIGEKAFGHAGRGGSIGFADPECRMSFGYVMNQLSTQILVDSRGAALIDATYSSFGYSNRHTGAWRL